MKKFNRLSESSKITNRNISWRKGFLSYGLLHKFFCVVCSLTLVFGLVPVNSLAYGAEKSSEQTASQTEKKASNKNDSSSSTLDNSDSSQQKQDQNISSDAEQSKNSDSSLNNTVTAPISNKSNNANYLTFTSQQAGSTVTFKYLSGDNAQYSTDGGNTWTTCKSAKDAGHVPKSGVRKKP